VQLQDEGGGAEPIRKRKLKSAGNIDSTAAQLLPHWQKIWRSAGMHNFFKVDCVLQADFSAMPVDAAVQILSKRSIGWMGRSIANPSSGNLLQLRACLLPHAYSTRIANTAHAFLFVHASLRLTRKCDLLHRRM
jgi:hypothetical protein